MNSSDNGTFSGHRAFFYGTGISRQPLSPISLGRGLIGHWGQSGAFAFHHPESGLYFTGTVNQAVGQSAAVQAMTIIIRHYGRRRRRFTCAQTPLKQNAPPVLTLNMGGT